MCGKLSELTHSEAPAIKMKAKAVLCVDQTQMVGALIGTYDLTGRSITGDGRQKLSREEKEERRRKFFKQRPLGEQVLSADVAEN